MKDAFQCMARRPGAAFGDAGGRLARVSAAAGGNAGTAGTPGGAMRYIWASKK